MDFGYWISLLWFLLLFRAAKFAFAPDGVYRTECRDRYLMIAVDLSFTGQEPFFEAVGETGVYPITEEYAAQCGYTISVFTGILELRTSYFSCHTANQNDQIFTFNFNLITSRDDQNISYALTETCSPSLPWSPREVTCEVNYLEVSVHSNMMCPLGPKPETGNISMQMVYSSAATADWQMVLVKTGPEMKPLNHSEAALNGYFFTVTENRLVFRAAYGQPYSSNAEVDDNSVEVAHAIVFSRQEWLVLIVDLIASCTVSEAPQNGSGYMTWQTPFTLFPGLNTTSFSFGLNGELWEPTVAEDKGYTVTSDTTAIKIGVPYNANGANRRSVVSGDLFDLFTCHFYMEQIATRDGGTETRTRTFRKLSSSVKRFLHTENRTVPDEEMFTVYLSNVPEDLELVSVQMNEKVFQAPFVNSSSYTLNITAFPNNTYGYTLKVPFDNSFIIKRFSSENGVTENELNIAYTVMILPGSELHSYHTTVTALSGIPPPQFNALCSESGITFTLDHEPSDFLWDIIVGSNPLTSELAVQQGYIMRNNSKTLQLEVPLFTHGYKYEHITLEGFLGTFETYIRNRKTSQVLSSSAKTCPFTANEIVVCSKDGTMTVVADLTEAVVSGGSPLESSLLSEYCAPLETDATRVLFSFPLNSCDTKVELDGLSVIYTNEILFSLNDSAQIGRILVQCMYPLVALHRLFTKFTFESETAGVGRIVHPLPTVSPSGPQRSTRIPTMTDPTTMKPDTTEPSTKPDTKPTTSTSRPQIRKSLAYRSQVQYIKVLSNSMNIQNRVPFSKTL